MNTRITASAPGRVCFAGEDIDWISGPSILGAIDLRLAVTVLELPADNDFIVLTSSEPFNVERRIRLAEIQQYDGHIMDYVQAALKVVLDQGVKPVPLKISVSSSLPARAGLGSSAAVSIASIAALAEFYGLTVSPLEACRLAYLVESQELQTGAGQMDFYVSGLGGFMYINSALMPPSVKNYSFPQGLAILIADTGVPRSTAHTISTKRARLESGEAGIASYVKHTESAIEQMHRLLSEDNDNLNRFGSLMSSCHGYLDEYMRVSTETLNRCVTICLENGALGAKLTGTGMGGCMFAVVPESRIAEAREALSTQPVTIYVTHISNNGVLWSNDVQEMPAGPWSNAHKNYQV